MVLVVMVPSLWLRGVVVRASSLFARWAGGGEAEVGFFSLRLPAKICHARALQDVFP